MRRSLFATVMIYVAVAAFVVSVLAPVAWLFIMSISNANDLTTIPLRWIPAEPDFSRYARLFSLEEGSAGLAFLSALRNSIVVAVSATVIALACGFARRARRFLIAGSNICCRTDRSRRGMRSSARWR